MLFNPNLLALPNPWGYLDLWSRRFGNRLPVGASAFPSVTNAPQTPNLSQVPPLPRLLPPPRISPPRGANLFSPQTLNAPTGSSRARQNPTPNAIEPWNNPPRPPPPPPSPPPNQGQSNTTSNTTASTPQTPNTPNNGATYYPKPEWWVTQQSAFAPLTFPGVERRGDGHAWYQDGSHVDYGSAAWKMAAGYLPTEHADLWQAIPDSWKAEMATWDRSFVTAYLEALSRYNQGGNFGGKYMSGAEAAAEIVKLAREAKAREQAANKAKGYDAKPPPNFERFSPAIVG